MTPVFLAMTLLPVDNRGFGEDKLDLKEAERLLDKGRSKFKLLLVKLVPLELGLGDLRDFLN